MTSAYFRGNVHKIFPARLASLSLLFLAALLWSCAPKSAPQTAGIKTTQQPAAASAAKEGWEMEWAKIAAAARKEGRVVINGPAIVETRQGFIENFQKAYPGITLEYTGMLGSMTAPKIKAERGAGIYQWDLYIGGTTTILNDLRAFALPIRPFLVLPKVKSPELWLDGKIDFADDKEEINLVFSNYANSQVVYNSDLVSPSELTSFWDLTKPKWKGKIVMRDPRTAGGGLDLATFWYLHPQLGLEYIKALAASEPLLVRDRRLQVEYVARGKYSISLSSDTPSVIEFQKLGMPLKWAGVMKEGTTLAASTGTVIMLDKAPHPNAATVFLNWLLGKEGQKVWSTTSGFASRRLDVPAEHLVEAMRLPKPGSGFEPSYKEKRVVMKDEVVGQLNRLFSGQ